MTGPEVVKLARLLGVEPEELAALDAVPERDLRALREQVTDRLFDGDSRSLQRIADVAGRLPVPLVATVGRRTFGPVLCARLAGLLDPGRAIDVAERWPEEFVAAVAAEMDPRRASAVVAEMPPERTVAVARVLAREREYVAMGRFVGHLDHDTLVACLEAIDDESLLRSAYVLEGRAPLDGIVAALPDERLAALVDLGLERELEHLRGHLGKKQAARLDAAGR